MDVPHQGKLSGRSEFFFDDDTFNIQKERSIELRAKLKPLGITRLYVEAKSPRQEGKTTR